MSAGDRNRPDLPDVQQLADSMLLMYSGHDCGDEHSEDPSEAAAPGAWAKARSFTDDPGRAAEIRAATGRDQSRYLNAGLTPVDCLRCGTTVSVKKLGREYTAVQWNSVAVQQCSHFAELREEGRDSSRTRSCPDLAASIGHAVAEGLLEEGLLEETPNPD